MDSFTTWVQRRLKHHDVYPGPIDGIPGALTHAAIAAFQKRHGLPVSGVADDATVKTLRVCKSNSNVGLDFMKPRPELPSGGQEPAWLVNARRYVGVEEVQGRGENPQIRAWADGLGLLDYDGDDTPWCGLFTAAMLTSTAIGEPIPGQPLVARTWLHYGAPVEERTGAVVVFWRGEPEGWQGHVGFVVGGNKTHVACLGGNQANAVNVRAFPRERVLGFRWPKSVPQDVFDSNYDIRSVEVETVPGPVNKTRKVARRVAESEGEQ